MRGGFYGYRNEKLHHKFCGTWKECDYCFELWVLWYLNWLAVPPECYSNGKYVQRTPSTCSTHKRLFHDILQHMHLIFICIHILPQELMVQCLFCTNTLVRVEFQTATQETDSHLLIVRQRILIRIPLASTS